MSYMCTVQLSSNKHTKTNCTNLHHAIPYMNTKTIYKSKRAQILAKLKKMS